MAKTALSLHHPKQTIELTPVKAREIFVKNRCGNYDQLQVDYTLFYLDHCKVHPIDLVLNTIKEAAENKDANKVSCTFFSSQVFNNLDYEPKTIKKSSDLPKNFWQKITHKTTHKEWEDHDYDHENHYWKLTENIMHELQIYLLKTGWLFEVACDPTCEKWGCPTKYLTIYF